MSQVVKRIRTNDQPDHATKLRRLAGEEVGWDYLFKAPPVCTAFWSREDWINFIGHNWFRTTAA